MAGGEKVWLKSSLYNYFAVSYVYVQPIGTLTQG